MMSDLPRFERRRRLVRVPRSAPAPNTPATEQEAAQLDAIDQQLEEAARAMDGRFDAFARFFAAEHRKYGPAVRPGQLATFWIAYHTGSVRAAVGAIESLPAMDRTTTTILAQSLRPDSELSYVTEAVDEFDELERAGRLRERRRERLATVRRRPSQSSRSKPD